MTVGLTAGLTSAVGDELNALGGLRITRLTAPLLTDVRIVEGYLSAESTDLGITVDLTGSDTFGAATAGMIFRITSGLLAGYEATIQSVSTTTQIVLVAPGMAVDFSAQSWEVLDRQTTANVETTLDWDTSGRVFIDGVLYTYASITLSTLDGLEHFDGELFRPGAGRDHAPLAEVLDFTRTFSALDQLRRSLFVETATGEDLNVVGRNIAVLRPPPLTDDDTFRAVIKATAYAPKSTIYALELALDALLGEVQIQSGFRTASGVAGPPSLVTLSSGTFSTDAARGMRFRITSGTLAGKWTLIQSRDSGTQLTLQADPLGDFDFVDWEITQPNWEIFEDLTLGSLRNAATVFLGRTDDPELSSVGKTFLDGDELQPMTADDTLSLDAEPIRVEGLRFAPEGVERLIAEGDTCNVTIGVNQTAIVTTPSLFTSVIQPGDLFVVTSGTSAGDAGTIRSVDSVNALTAGPLRGVANATLTVDATNVAWKIIRPISNFRFYRPSAEYYIERPGGSGVAIWVREGTLGEGSPYVTLEDDPNGEYLSMVDGGGGAVESDTVYYTHAARIDPSSYAAFGLTMDLSAAILGAGDDNARQFCLQIEDGQVLAQVGMTWDGVTATREVGLLDSSGAFIGTPATVGTPNGWGYVEIVKLGESWVLVRVDGNTVQVLPYSALDSSSERRLAFGCQCTSDFGAGRVKAADWRITTERDFWNTRVELASTTSEHLTDASTSFLATDDDAPIPKRVFVRSWTALNAAGGNTAGEWEIAEYVSTGDVRVTGPRRYRGGFSTFNRSRFIVRDDPAAFIWPRVRGHSVEILTGDNAGTYPIAAVLDPVPQEEPVRLLDVEQPPTAANGDGWFRIVVNSLDPLEGTYQLTDFATGPRIRIWGLVSGEYIGTVVDILPLTGTLIDSPTYDNGSIVAIETVILGPSDATFPHDVIVYEGPAESTVTTDRTEIIRLPGGMRSYGRPNIVAASGDWSSPELVAVEYPSNAVLLDTAGGSPSRPDGFDATTEEAEWRIVPSFPTDAGPMIAEIVDTGTQSDEDLTLRAPIPITPSGEYPLMTCARSMVLSAQIGDEQRTNISSSPGVYSDYPFYLADAFGFIRPVLGALVAAGITPDFYRLFRDSTGAHLIGE